jgi:hypothetical protein
MWCWFLFLFFFVSLFKKISSLMPLLLISASCCICSSFIKNLLVSFFSFGENKMLFAHYNPFNFFFKIIYKQGSFRMNNPVGGWVIGVTTLLLIFI